MEDAQNLIQALSVGSRIYHVVPLGNGRYSAQCGSLPLNILCGCFAQYYAYTIDLSNPDAIQVISAVPCGGFWGGAIGVAKNNAETARVRKALAASYAKNNI